MLKIKFFILTFFVVLNNFGQPISNDSIKIVCRDCFQGNYSYYLNGKKVDINKIFFKLENIKSIELLSFEAAFKLFNDTTKAGTVLITSKPSLLLLTLKNFFIKNNIDTNKIDYDDIHIDGKQILDKSVLVDSQAKFSPIYLKYAGSNKKGEICGIHIYIKEK